MNKYLLTLFVFVGASTTLITAMEAPVTSTNIMSLPYELHQIIIENLGKANNILEAIDNIKALEETSKHFRELINSHFDRVVAMLVAERAKEEFERKIKYLKEDQKTASSDTEKELNSGSNT